MADQTNEIFGGFILAVAGFVLFLVFVVGFSIVVGVGSYRHRKDRLSGARVDEHRFGYADDGYVPGQRGRRGPDDSHRIAGMRIAPESPLAGAERPTDNPS